MHMHTIKHVKKLAIVFTVPHTAYSIWFKIEQAGVLKKPVSYKLEMWQTACQALLILHIIDLFFKVIFWLSLLLLHCPISFSFLWWFSLTNLFTNLLSEYKSFAYHKMHETVVWLVWDFLATSAKRPIVRVPLASIPRSIKTILHCWRSSNFFIFFP